jgi:hypothetical protein
MEDIEVEVQEFDGKEYVLFKTITYNDSYFDVFGNPDDTNDIRVYKQVNNDGEVYYKMATSDEFINVMALCA